MSGAVVGAIKTGLINGQWILHQPFGECWYRIPEGHETKYTVAQIRLRLIRIEEGIRVPHTYDGLDRDRSERLRDEKRRLTAVLAERANVALTVAVPIYPRYVIEQGKRLVAGIMRDCWYIIDTTAGKAHSHYFKQSIAERECKALNLKPITQEVDDDDDIDDLYELEEAMTTRSGH